MGPDIQKALVKYQDEIDVIVREKGTGTPELQLLVEIKNLFTDIRSELALKNAEIVRLQPKQAEEAQA